jgi:tetratricopeptide (TPR) repeat protein
LFIWGTRSDGSQRAWTQPEFRKAVFGSNAEKESPVRLLSYWLGAGPRPGSTNADLVLKALFGIDPQFEHFRVDLRAAWAASKGVGKNIRTRNLDRASSKSIVDPISYENLNKAASEIGIARNILEVLAARFGYEELDDSNANILDFLKVKAREYKEFKDKINFSTKDDVSHLYIFSSGHICVDGGDYNEAEQALDLLERKFSGQSALESANILSKISILKGNAAIVTKDATEALKNYDAAARHLSPFDKSADSALRRKLAREYIRRVRYRPGEYEDVVFLLEPALLLAKEWSCELAMVRFDMAYALCNSGLPRRNELDIPTPRGERAVEYFRLAFNVIDNYFSNQDYIAMCKIAEAALRCSAFSYNTRNDRIMSKWLIEEAEYYSRVMERRRYSKSEAGIESSAQEMWFLLANNPCLDPHTDL